LHMLILLISLNNLAQHLATQMGLLNAWRILLT
jgi:hypothetical protein